MPGELRYRDLVGAALREWSRRIERDAGCDGLEWRLLSAYNEAFNNIVEHAYAAATGEVSVDFEVDDDRVVLQLVDEGAGFDFEASGAHAPPDDIDLLSDGGMGLYIIRQSMTSVAYERRGAENHLTMTKLLSECPPAADSAHEATGC